MSANTVGTASGGASGVLSSAGREFFHATANSGGVIPDFSEFDRTARGGAGSDAKRCVVTTMMDHNFYAADPGRWRLTHRPPAAP